MMIQENKQASVIIYALILVNLVLIMAMVILNNTLTLENNFKFHQNNKAFNENIYRKADWSFSLSNVYNSNGSGFIDVISCPDSVTMSGTLYRTTNIVTSLVYNAGNIYCEGIHTNNSSKAFQIYFDTGFTTFDQAEFQSVTAGLTVGSNKNGVSNFSDDNTLISFMGTTYQKPDTIDDNFNSDNYNAYSTGVVNYPGGYVDDDELARTLVYGYIQTGSGYENVFWNNSQMENYIEANSNNTGSTFQTIKSQSGYLYLNINQGADMKLVVFDKGNYVALNELTQVSQVVKLGLVSGSGYIQNDLSLSPTKTTFEYSFDFENYDYGLFVQNTSTGVLTYTITGETLSGSGIYINPINDSEETQMKYFGGDIILGMSGIYSGNQIEVVKKK